MTTYTKPRPRVGPDNAPFWQGCREHRLLLPTCRACGKAHLPPGPVCPFCFVDMIEWQQASGHGENERILAVAGPGSIIDELSLFERRPAIGKRHGSEGFTAQLH